MDTRARRFVPVLLLLAVVVALLLWLRPAPAPPEPVNSSEPAQHFTPVPSVGRIQSGPLVPDAFREPEAEPPIIDQISVEKDEVCEGEENLITVKAHTKDPRDMGYLRYYIAGEVGPQVAIKSYLRDHDGLPGHTRTIQVVGRSNATTTVDVPTTFTVKDCRAPHALIVSFRAMLNTSDEFQFFATVMDVSPKDRFKPTRFVWKFGDDQVDESNSPVTTHRYESLADDRLYSSFLVTVEAYDKNDRKLVGRLPVNVLNPEFENLQYKGLLVLSYSMNPRFPTIDANGVVEQKVRIWHNRPLPVTLRKATIVRQLANSEGSLQPIEVDPSSLLGTVQITSDGIEVPFRFDTKSNERVINIDYEFTGDSAEGFPVALRFSIMKPPDLPGPDKGDRVTDPVLVAKIKKTRELLKKQFVNDDDIWQLEKEGAFADLKAEPGTKRTPVVPANLPKPQQGGLGMETVPAPTGRETEHQSPEDPRTAETANAEQASARKNVDEVQGK